MNLDLDIKHKGVPFLQLEVNKTGVCLIKDERDSITSLFLKEFSL